MKSMKKAVRKLIRQSKYSYSVNLPKEFVERYGWKEKQKLTIEDKGGGVIVVKDWRRK